MRGTAELLDFFGPVEELCVIRASWQDNTCSNTRARSRLAQCRRAVEASRARPTQSGQRGLLCARKHVETSLDSLRGVLQKSHEKPVPQSVGSPRQAVASAQGPGPHGEAPGEVEAAFPRSDGGLRTARARAGLQMGLPDSCIRGKGPLLAASHSIAVSRKPAVRKRHLQPRAEGREFCRLADEPPKLGPISLLVCFPRPETLS